MAFNNNDDINGEVDYSALAASQDKTAMMEVIEENPPLSRKRQLTSSPSRSPRFCEDESDEAPNHINMNEFPTECPEGIHPLLWNMLRSIKTDTTKTNEQVAYVSDKVLILEAQYDQVGTEIAVIKKDIQKLSLTNQILTNRLLRAETVVERQRADMIDLRMRMMRDNIIIKTKGTEYQERERENTTAIFKAFVEKELRVADAGGFDIPRSHRMGQANNGYNRMIIAKVPNDYDQRRIFGNANVLQNTNYSISKQIPSEVEERRMFGWHTYKKARQENKFARFEGGRLYIDREPVTAIDPVCLPQASSALSGVCPPKVPVGFSADIESSDHHFRSWAVPVSDLQGVREGLDHGLSNGLSGGDFAPYGFRFKDNNGKIIENFDSDADYGTGLAILKTLRQKQAVNIAVYTSHNIGAGNPLPMKMKITAIQKAVEEALGRLGNN